MPKVVSKKDKPGKVQRESKSGVKTKSIKQGKIISYIVLFLIVFILYGNTVKNDYCYDDTSVIQLNQLTQKGFKGIPTLLTKAYWYGLTGINTSYYRPVSLVTFAIEKQIFGNNPHAGHFFNVLLFAVTGLLIFSILLKFQGETEKNKGSPFLLPFLASLLFIAHPVHTEVVANIKSRDEILGFLFSLLALYEVLIFESSKKIIHLVIATVCMLLAFMSKESAITFIAVVPLVFFLFKNTSIKKSLLLSVPFLLALGIYLGMRAHFLDSFITGKEGAKIMDNSIMAAGSLADQYATIIHLLGRYLWILIFPHPLIYTYSYNQIPVVGWTDPLAIISLLVYIAAAFYAIRILIRKSSSSNENVLVAFGILYFLITISLVSNVFLKIGVSFAERLVYAPSLGFCILLAYFIIRLTKVDFKKSITKNFNFMLISGIIMLGFSCKTIIRNKDWKNNDTLFTADIDHADRSAVAHHSYGSIIFNQAKNQTDSIKKSDLIREAITQEEKAVEIYDEYADAYHTLGDLYAYTHRPDEAISNYRKSIRYNDQYPPAYSNLGLVYEGRGQYDSAIACYREAISINKNFWNAYYNMGLAYGKQGKLDSAIQYFLKVIPVNTNYSPAYSNLGTAYGMKGDRESAIYYFSKALELDPNDYMSCMNLSTAYQQKGDSVTAGQFRDRAYRINPGLAK